MKRTLIEDIKQWALIVTAQGSPRRKMVQIHFDHLSIYQSIEYFRYMSKLLFAILRGREDISILAHGVGVGWWGGGEQGLSIAFKCVLRCPLADPAGTTTAFLFTSKTTPYNQIPQKNSPIPTRWTDTTSHCMLFMVLCNDLGVKLHDRRCSQQQQEARQHCQTVSFRSLPLLSNLSPISQRYESLVIHIACKLAFTESSEWRTIPSVWGTHQVKNKNPKITCFSMVFEIKDNEINAIIVPHSLSNDCLSINNNNFLLPLRSGPTNSSVVVQDAVKGTLLLKWLVVLQAEVKA